MRADMTNNALGRFLSLEFLAMMLMGGIAWGSLTSNVDALDDEVNDHSERHTQDISRIQTDQKALTDDVSTINRKLDVIENNQRHFRDKMESTSRAQMETLRILRQEFPPNHNGDR